MPKLLIHGIDSLYVSFYLDTSRGQLDWDDLAYLKEKAKRSHAGAFERIDLGSERFALMAYGKKPYTFVLINRAFEIRLSENLKPSCHVRFASEALWLDGLDQVLARFHRWCVSLDLVATRSEVVSRVDASFDFHLPVIDFEPGHVVTRATKKGTWQEHGQVQSLQIGKGDIVVRLYDKVAEITQQSGKAWFFELWGRKAGVCRIEFQLRGDRLRLGGIRTLADLGEHLGDLLREVATNHTSLRRPGADGNRSRWPLHPLWRALRGAIDQFPQSGLVRVIDPVGLLEWRLHGQITALHGLLKAIAAVLSLIRERDEPLALSELLGSLESFLRRNHSEPLWRADVAQRMMAHGLGLW